MDNANQTKPQLRPRAIRAEFQNKPETYGHSVLGAPLLYFPAQINSPERGLILAGTHGDETASITALSCALRTLPAEYLKHDVILSMNPDGNQLGTRANANQVDLNRAFPTKTWTDKGTVYRWSTSASERDVKVKTGNVTTLEPEISALVDLIEARRPQFVVSLHEPLACIDDPEHSDLGKWLAKRFSLPLIDDVGYDTPGSFGSWCDEKGLPCITLEFPAISADNAIEEQLEALIDLLQYSSTSA
ncbi:murein tripeptide amidase MpaA [Vibrio sp. ER1A]|uniref:murein tripeptide amidase MpaA n=1 Tax=Vibrio sp. ER1A TaxID=1517681 RepID=UPI0004DCD965|nr:murein tripeptide amidase MpaA [Vibrio sp. ER1A]KFA98144.1 murein peptide amidase A [Vibrio sp. ER1A]